MFKNIKSYIYKHKEVFKVIFNILRIIIITSLFVIMKVTDIPLVEQTEVLKENFNITRKYIALNNLNTFTFNISVICLLLPIIFSGTYIKLYNYFTGIQNFTLSRSKNISGRRKIKLNYISKDIKKDSMLILLGLIASIIVNGIGIDILPLILITILKTGLSISMFIIFPILLSDNLKELAGFILFFVIFNYLILVQFKNIDGIYMIIVISIIGYIFRKVKDRIYEY